jgi:hypothetical protein
VFEEEENRCAVGFMEAAERGRSISSIWMNHTLGRSWTSEAFAAKAIIAPQAFTDARGVSVLRTAAY